MVDYDFNAINILYIALAMYVLIIVFSLHFKMTWLLMLAGLLWFIPILLVPDTWIVLLSAVMVVAHMVIGFTGKDDDFI